MSNVAPRGLNLTFVRDQLAVGGSFPKADVERLAKELSIRHVVDARVEETDDAALLAAHGIEFLHVPTRDHHAMGRDTLSEGVEWIVPRIIRGDRVLIHCEHGIGRSVLLSLCVLVRLGERPIDALTRIKRARPCASPSPAQLEVFLVWCTTEVERLPSWDELARVAYFGVKEARPAASTTPSTPEGLGV